MFFGTGAYIQALFQFNFAGDFLAVNGSYYTIFVIFLISYFATWRMERSRFGAQLVAVRENKDAAEALFAPIIGGLGTRMGPLVGSFFIHGGGEAAKAVMRLSDYTYVLNHGAMIASGTPQQVTRAPHVIEAYLGHGAAARLAEMGADNA